MDLYEKLNFILSELLISPNYTITNFQPHYKKIFSKINVSEKEFIDLLDKLKKDEHIDYFICGANFAPSMRGKIGTIRLKETSKEFAKTGYKDLRLNDPIPETIKYNPIIINTDPKNENWLKQIIIGIIITLIGGYLLYKFGWNN